MTEYEECPFCDRLFEKDESNVARPIAWKPPLQVHIEQDHHKVRVRRGSNYRWMDRAQVEQLVAVQKAKAMGVKIPTKTQDASIRKTLKRKNSS